MSNDIEQQVYTALEDKKPSLTHQTIMASFKEALDTFLGCQHISIGVLEQQTNELYPIGIVGNTSENEHQWHEVLQGMNIRSLVGDAQKLSQLQAGEILSLHMMHTALKNSTSLVVIAPIHSGEQLIGVLLLDYGRLKTIPDDSALISSVARLAALLIEREKVQSERDKALLALREANEQLEHMHKSKSEFVSVVSHEFRSALTTIQGFSEMLCQKDLSVADMKEFAVDIYQDTQHLSRMVKDMLDLERMEMGRIQLHFGWLDLNAVIMEAVNRMRPVAEQHTIHVKLANALPVLMGDADKLTHVIENLLDNALKYSPDGGDVYISSAVEGGAVHVCVQDNGIGIPADAINRIFERYERVETKINQSIPGTGLGLSLVRQIVRIHGGQVWAESVLGEGSRFHFTVQFVNSPIHINGLLS